MRNVFARLLGFQAVIYFSFAGALLRNGADPRLAGWVMLVLGVLSILGAMLTWWATRTLSGD